MTSCQTKERIMAHADITMPSKGSSAPHGRRWLNLLALLVVLALIGAGGWWAYQTGLVGQTTELAAMPAQSQAGEWGQQGRATNGAASAQTAATQPDQPVAVTNKPIPAPDEAGRGEVTSAPISTPAATTTYRSGPIPVIAGIAGVQVWDDTGAALELLESGTKLNATGRSADSRWLTIETATGTAWVQTDQVIAYDVQQLPQVDLPAPVSTAVEALTADEATASSESTSAVSTTVATAPATTAIAATTAPAATRESAEAPIATVSTTSTRLNVRAGPGTDYPIVDKAEPGDQYVVLGRNEAGDWLQLALSDAEDGFGWVAAEYTQVSGEIADLAVSDAVRAAPVEAADQPVTPSAAASNPVASTQAIATTGSTGLRGTIVFQQSIGGMIYAYDLATGKLWELTTGADPAISPDGKTVAFVRDGGENGLYLIDIDGSNERLIFGERNRVSSPKWSPDGAWILFSRNDSYLECYAMSERECLLPEAFEDRFPNGAPFEIPLVKEYTHRLSAVDVNGDGFHDIPALDSARAPDWGAGGIVYQSKAGLQRTADAQTAVTQAVAFDPLKPFYYDPAWQPGGGQIAFQVKGAAQWEIYVVNSDGAAMTALTRPATALVDELPSNVAPAYSPDGQHIVFLSNRTDDHAAGPWRLWVMNADGSNQQPLPIDIPIEYTFGLEQVVSWGA
jgi:uncharacterized protein YraI